MTSELTDEIEAGFALMLPEHTVAELRILNTRRGTLSGYFTDRRKMAVAAAAWSGKASGVYFTLNLVHPDLFARSANRLTEFARHTTGDRDILWRAWLPLDFDPVRRAGISSTNEEHRAALERAEACEAYLAKAFGWTGGVRADSGNGAHLLYRIDWPNDGLHGHQVRELLHGIATVFSDDEVQVDTATFNAARIWKVYGTLACKGDDVPERPYRRARLLCPGAGVSPLIAPAQAEDLEGGWGR